MSCGCGCAQGPPYVKSSTPEHECGTALKPGRTLRHELPALTDPCYGAELLVVPFDGVIWCETSEIEHRPRSSYWTCDGYLSLLGVTQRVRPTLEPAQALDSPPDPLTDLQVAATRPEPLPRAVGAVAVGDDSIVSCQPRSRFARFAAIPICRPEPFGDVSAETQGLSPVAPEYRGKGGGPASNPCECYCGCPEKFGAIGVEIPETPDSGAGGGGGGDGASHPSNLLQGEPPSPGSAWPPEMELPPSWRPSPRAMGVSGGFERPEPFPFPGSPRGGLGGGLGANILIAPAHPAVPPSLDGSPGCIVCGDGGPGAAVPPLHQAAGVRDAVDRDDEALFDVRRSGETRAWSGRLAGPAGRRLYE